ncbi:MAG: hypothetical protein WC799_25330 [Desulfobacteraceae bacterium]
MNADNHEVSRLTLSFSSLELEYLTSTFSLTGSLSWGENTSESYTHPFHEYGFTESGNGQDILVQ